MMKHFSHAFYYSITYQHNAFAICLNGRLVGNIQKNSSGRWPVHLTVNNLLYSLEKRRRFKTFIELREVETGELKAVLIIPFFSAFYPFIKTEFINGKVLTWEVENFFSLHWRWKNNRGKLMDAIENLAGEHNSGVIGMQEYNEEADLLIVTGFFLSLLRRSKLSMGIRGLKRKTIRR